jgi:hypothetical protein
LRNLHPANQNVRPKIRQQLQLLVANRILVRTERGRYARVGFDVSTRRTLDD